MAAQLENEYKMRLKPQAQALRVSLKTIAPIKNKVAAFESAAWNNNAEDKSDENNDQSIRESFKETKRTG